MGKGKRGAKRVHELARDLGLKSKELYPILARLDGSRDWDHHAMGVPAALERRVRELVQDAGPNRVGAGLHDGVPVVEGGKPAFGAGIVGGAAKDSTAAAHEVQPRKPPVPIPREAESSAVPVAADVPAEFARPAGMPKALVRRGESVVDTHAALHLPSQTWSLPPRSQPGQTGQLVLHFFVMSVAALAAITWLVAGEERAEWLATDGVHGHPILLIAGIALAALCPVHATLGGSKLRILATSAGLVLRGVATGAACVLVPPSQGDLWNRAHEMSLVLVGIIAFSWLQFWNILARPTAWILALAVRRGPLGVAAMVARRVSGIDARGVLREREFEMGGIPGSVPDWLLSAVELRATRSLRRALEDPCDSSVDAHSADAELELTAVLGAHPEDLRSIASRSLMRVATSLAVTLDAIGRLEEQRQPRWPWAEKRLRLLVAVLDRLQALGGEDLASSSRLIRDLSEAVWTQDLCADTALLERSLGAPADRRRTGLSAEIDDLFRLTVALRLQDERVLGWSEAVASGVLSMRAGAEQGGPIWLLASLLDVMARRESLGALRTAGLEAEVRRIETETRLLSEGLGLLESGGRIGRRRRGRELARLAPLPMAIRARALLVPRERRVMHLLGARGFRAATAVLLSLLAGVLVWGSWAFVFGSGAAVEIHDPFRAEQLGFRGEEVVATAFDDRSQEIVLATSDRVHAFEPDLFKHATEFVGGSGPSASVRDLVPLIEGGLLARTGRDGAGLELREGPGSWSTWIAPPDESIGSPEILDLAVNESGETLLLTSGGLLLYEPAIRRIQRVSLEPLIPQEPVALARLGGEFLLIEKGRILALERDQDGFRSELVALPTGLGLASSAVVDDGRLLVRTDRDALIALRSVVGQGQAIRQWKILAGGDQLGDLTGVTVALVTVAPESGSLAMVLDGEEGEEIWIRKGSERFWSRALLADGEAVLDGIAPVLSPDGEMLVYLAQDRRLRLVRRSAADPLACDVAPLLADRATTFLGSTDQGIVAIHEYQGGLELRSVTWSEMPAGGTRVRTIFPMRFAGVVVGAFVRPTLPHVLVVTTSRGEVVEYDTRTRSMVGELREFAREQSTSGDWVGAVCWSPEGLVVTDTAGGCALFEDPVDLKGGESALGLALIRSIVDVPVARQPGEIAMIFDTPRGFEAITVDGDAWEYRLKGGWRDVAPDIDPIAADSLKRLSSGVLLGLTRGGDVIWRADGGWESIGVQLVQLIPSTESLTGLDENGSVIQVVSAGGGRPSSRVLARAPRPAGLTPPIRDVLGDGEGQALWVAHEGGLSQYDIQTGTWSEAVEGISAVRRIEPAVGGLYVEQMDGHLLHLGLQGLVVRRLMEGLRSWAADDSGVAVAVSGRHELVRCVGAEVATLVQPNPGLSQGGPLSVTATEGSLLVLEEERLLIGAAGEPFDEIPLPCEDPRALVRAEEDLLLLDGAGGVHRMGIDALGPSGSGWEPAGLAEVRELVQLEGAVVAIGENRSAWRYEGEGRFRPVLNGPAASRVGPLLAEGEAVESEGGLWLRSEEGVTRWDPGGGGDRLEIGQGALRVINGRPYHWGPNGLRLLPSSGRLRSGVIYAADVAHLLAASDGPRVVADGAIVDPRDKRFRIMGPSPGRGGRVVDLAKVGGARFAVLTESGDVQVYDPTSRRFELALEAEGPVGLGRVYGDGARILLVVAENGDVTGGLLSGRPAIERDARGVAVSSGTPIALSGSGEFKVFDPSRGWSTRGPVRQRGAESRIRDRVRIQDRIWMLADDGRLLSYAGRGLPASVSELPRVQRPEDLISVSGDRLLVLGGQSRGGGTEMAIRTREGRWETITGMPVATGGDPLVVGTRNDWVGDLTGRKLWEAMGTVEPHEPVDIVPEAGGRALVLAADGRVRRYRADRAGLELVAGQAVRGAARLLVAANSLPVVLSDRGGLRFTDRAVDVAPGTAVLQGERGVWSIDTSGRLNKDGEPVDLTGFAGWDALGRFPVDPAEVEVLEAGGRVWAQGGGASLELLAGESWRESDLDGVDLDGDLLRSEDDLLVAAAKAGGFVRIPRDGSTRRIATELASARLVPGASAPMALAADGSLLLRIPTDGDVVEPVVLNEQAMRFDHVVAVAAQGPFGAVDREGRIWWREEGGRWQAISDAGFAGADWAIVPVERSGAAWPVSAELDALLLTTSRDGRVTVRGIGPGGVSVDLASPFRAVPLGLAFLGGSAALRALNEFTGRLAVGPCGLVSGIDRLEFSPDRRTLVYSGPFPEVGEAVADLLSESGGAWTRAGWSRGRASKPDGAGFMQFGSWDGRVRKADRILRSRTPIQLRAVDGDRLECLLQNGTALQIGAGRRTIDCDFRLVRMGGVFGGRSGTSSFVEIRHGERWVPFYQSGERQVAHHQAADGPGKLVFSDRHGAVLVNESGCVLRFEKSARCIPVALGSAAVAQSVELHAVGTGRPKVLVRGTGAAWWLGRDGSSAASSPPPPPVLDPGISDIEACGLTWARDESWPRVDGRVVRLMGRCFEHELPVRCGDRDGRAVVEVVVGGARFTRRLALSGSILGPMQSGSREEWSREESVDHPAGLVVLDRDDGSLRLTWESGESERWDSERGAFPSEIVTRAEWTGKGWIHATEETGLVWSSLDLQDTVRVGGVDGLEIMDLRRAPGGVVHVLTDTRGVLAVNAGTRDSTIIELGESSFGAPGPSRGYALTGIGVGAAAARLASKGGRVVTSSGKWLPSSGCFEFELCDLEALRDLGSRPAVGAIRVPSLAGPVYGLARGGVKPGIGEWRPPPIDVSGGGLRVLHSAFERGSAEPVVHWTPGDGAEEVAVPWRLVDGLLPFDAVEGVSPGSADELFVWSRLGPRRLGPRRLEECKDVLSRPSSLKSLQPVGGFDSWFGEYAEIGVLQAEGGFSRVSASAVGPSLGSATDDDVIELEGVESSLVLTRRRAPWGRSVALRVASRGLTRTADLSMDGFACDLRQLEIVDGSDALAVQGAVLVRYPVGRGSLLGLSLMAESAGMDVALGRDESGREALEIRRPGQPPVRIDGAGLQEAAPLEASRNLQPRSEDGQPKVPRFDLIASDGERSRIGWQSSPGGDVRTLIEGRGTFDHDQVKGMAALEDSGPLLFVQAANTGQLALRSSDGTLIDVGEPGRAASQVRSGVDGGIWFRSDGSWREVILEGERLVSPGAGPLSALPIGASTLDWRLEWGDSVQVFSGGAGSLFESGWLPGDRLLGFARSPDLEILQSETGLRSRSREGEVPLAPSSEAGSLSVATNVRGPVFLDSDDDVSYAIAGDMVLERASSELNWLISASGVRVRGAATGSPWLFSRGAGEDASGGASAPFILGRSLPCDRVLAVGAAPEGMLAVTSPGLCLLGPARSEALVDVGPVGLPTGTRLGAPGIFSTEQEGSTGIWLGTDAGDFELKWSGSAYAVESGPGGSVDLRQTLRDEDRWSLFRDPTGAIRFSDARGGIVAEARDAILDGALRQDLLVEVGMDGDGTWIRTAATIERGVSGRRDEWAVVPVEAAEVVSQVPAWASRFESGDESSWGDGDPLLRRSQEQVLAGEDGVLAVDQRDRVYRLQSGLWVLRAVGELWWIKPERKWH